MVESIKFARDDRKFPNCHKNLIRERECVLNLPSAALVNSVGKLALSTRNKQISNNKRNMGYEYEKIFGTANLTASPAHIVNAPVDHECPVQLEANVRNIHSFDEPISIKAIEVEIIKTHIDESILLEGKKNYIDPKKWKPLIMNFRDLISLGDRIHLHCQKNHLSPIRLKMSIKKARTIY